MREKLAAEPEVNRLMPGNRTGLMAAVNAEIRVLAHRLGDHPEWNWPFVCECGDETCQEPVLCSLGAYDEVQENDEFVLARGHTVTRARAARARSHALREEGAVLRTRAEHQLRRARSL
jgi:hypothetical protein